jgi:hypothetical protein
MNVFNVSTEKGETIVAMESRNFKMRIINEVEVPQPDNIAYLSANVLDATEMKAYTFEIDLNNDPEFDKWDETLFEDAVRYYCEFILQIDNYIYGLTPQPQLYPYTDLDEESEFASVGNVELPF